jgi:hypothetical protein
MSAVPSGVSGMKKPFSNLPEIGTESIGKLIVGVRRHDDDG